MPEVVIGGAKMRRAGMGPRIARLAMSLALGASVVAAPGGAAAQKSCSNCEEPEKLAREVEALRREVDRVMRQLARQQGDSSMRRALSELRATREKLSEAEHALATSLLPGVAPRARVARMQQSPSGYLGVTISNAEHTMSSEGRLIAYYHDFPVVESVEPGSPAEKAGILTGDVILAYNGEDLKQKKIALADLLKPGAKVVVRVRRDGERKDIPVIVGRRPAMSYARVEVTPMPPTPPTPAAAPMIEWSWGDESPQRTPSPFSVAVGWGEALAGADLTASTRELAQFFGRSDGVVVLKVAPGSPAARAGLQVGDVITAAGGTEVDQPLDLQRVLMRRSDRKRVDLEVYRRPAPDKAPDRRTITLRW